MSQLNPLLDICVRIMTGLGSSLTVSAVTVFLSHFTDMSTRVLVPLLAGLTIFVFVIMLSVGQRWITDRLTLFLAQTGTLLPMIVCLIGIGGIGWGYIIVLRDVLNPFVEIPNVDNTNNAEAERVLRQKSLIPLPILQPHPKMEPGLVIPGTQVPAAGRKEYKGTQVSYFLSEKPVTPAPAPVSIVPLHSICRLDQGGMRPSIPQASLTSSDTRALPRRPPQLTTEEVQRTLPILPVPAGTYEVPLYLKDWLGEAPAISIPRLFYIMTREVTVGEFRRYAETLDEAQSGQFGNAWQGQKPGEAFLDERPVSSIPWKAAQGYADWLSVMTGCKLALPAIEHWRAAVIRYTRPQDEVTRSNPVEIRIPRMQPGKVVDLLGNLREWSADACPQDGKIGHYWLGEDYKTWRHEILGKPDCREHPQEIVGFRLIRQN